MPEGDTVYRAARRLDDKLTGRPLLRTDFRVPQHATADLSGGLVTGTVSRGKHLLTRIGHASGDWTLHTHLKMEGHWAVYRPGERWRRPAHQARVVLETDAHQAVGFSLGVVELVPTRDEDDVVGHLGPDLLGPDWDEAEALRRLGAEPARRIRDALLDQRNLAGIGNMYAAELCFVSGVRPTRPLGEVPDLARLVRTAKAMLELNKERPVQATTGDLRQGRRMWVYRRDREPCRRCGTPIEVAMLGDPAGPGQPARERAAYWCPRCQVS
jgi:endonuclease-8